MVGQNFKIYYGVQITSKCISKYTIYYALKQNLVQICKKFQERLLNGSQEIEKHTLKWVQKNLKLPPSWGKHELKKTDLV